MIWLGVIGALCWVAALVALSAAGRAQGAARVASAAERGALAAVVDAQVSSAVARAVTGIDFSFDRAHSAEADVSERIRQDLATGVSVMQRIYARARPPAQVSSHPDVFVKTNP